MSLYFKYLKIHFKSQLQYKASFIMNNISQFVNFFTYYFSITCLFDRFSNIKGFTLYEVLLTFSVIQIGSSFCETFFRGMDQFDDLVVDGSFDRLLTRPRNIFLQIFGEQIHYGKVIKLLQAIIVLIIALLSLNINYDIYKILTIIFMIISSVLIFLSVFILAAAYCFITIKGLEIRNILTDGSKHMAQYPIGIFKKGIIIFLTCILPFGFVNYYPLLYLLGRTTNKLYVISPLITLIYLLISIIVFKKGMRRYTSSGS